MLLKNLGITEAAIGRRDLAMVRLEEAMERHPAGGDDDGFGVSVLGNLGTIYMRLGAPRSARRAYAQALERARAGGRPSEISDVLGRLGYLSLELDRSEEARGYFRDALAAAGAAGPTAALTLLEGAAYAAAKTGHEAEAEDALELLVAEQRRLGNVTATCLALTELGAVPGAATARGGARRLSRGGGPGGRRGRALPLGRHWPGGPASTAGGASARRRSTASCGTAATSRSGGAARCRTSSAAARPGPPRRPFASSSRCSSSAGEQEAIRADLELAFAVLERGAPPA